MTIPARFGLAYAVLFAGVGIFYTYMALYLKAAGLTGTQIGIILAVLPLAGFITQPLWGLLSDIYQVRRSMLAAACFALAIIGCLYVVSDSFVWLLGCTIALAVVRSPVGPLCDALALEYLATGALVIGYSLQLILYLFSATMVIMGIVSLALPDAPRSDIRPTLRDGRAVLVAN